MSGIYIPGMKMPTGDNSITLFLFPDGKVVVCGTFGPLGHYEAVPVPEHGRLGDLDALTGQMQRNLFEIEDKAEKELGFDETLRRGMQYGHAVCVDAVNDAPTIIPADKNGDGT